MPKIILAIDPGQSGGFAWTDGEGRVHCKPMPETEGDVFFFLNGLTEIPVAVVEDQVGCVGPGVKVSSASMFKFGRGFGFLLGVLQACDYRIELVRPQTWQKFLGLGNSKQAGGKTPWKNKLKARAQRLYPQVNGTITLKTADALLIHEYAQAQ
jgi:hypothetical protein